MNEDGDSRFTDEEDTNDETNDDGGDEEENKNDDDGEAEEEAREEELKEGEEEDEEEVDQKTIDRTYIKALVGCNHPLQTYYKSLKNNLLIIFNSERIASRKYPKWSENLFDTFTKLNTCVPELHFVFQECGLTVDNIMLSAQAI